MHAVIIGAGIMGLSTARALLERGWRVSLFDQGSIPNPRSSSFDVHRLIRYPYGRHVDYMNMVAEAYRVWEKLWQDIGAVHYVETGTLLIGTAASGWAADSQDALLNAGIPLEILDRKTLAERFPDLFTEDVQLALSLKSGGVLLASRILDGLKWFLLARGAALHEQNAITDINFEAASVRLGDGRTFEADQIVVTAGAWTPRLLPDLAARITPSRQTIVYFDLPTEAAARWRHRPMILDIDETSGFYLVPPVSGTPLKVGDHRFSLKGDPNSHLPPTDSDIDAIVKATCHRLPEMDRYDVRSDTCFYAVTPEERFLCLRKPNAWVLSGFSGHGFKFGPLIGERIADAIEGHISEATFMNWLAGYESRNRRDDDNSNSM